MASSRLRQLNSALACWALFTLTNMPISNATAGPAECVIVLHGLARSSLAMRPVAKDLSKNYSVVNQGYPSRKYPIEELAKMAIEPALEQCADAPKIHFVTHSMGGILVRQYLAKNTIKELGHVVMLGPPNQGSELVDYFQRSAVSRWLFNAGNGPAGSQLGTDSNSLPKQLGAVNFSLGVIAGNTSYNPLFSRVLGGDDDGKVSVEHSKVEGMNDHIVLPTSHTFMMRNKQVITQVRHFLKNGVFAKI